MINHKQKISQPHFLFSAENPKYPDKNKLKMTHEQAIKHLNDKGYSAHEVAGHYGSPERSIAVYDIKPHHVEHLHNFASKLGQDSSIHSTGKEHEMRFHHGEDKGKKVKGKGTTFHAEKPKDFYTTLPSGEHFTHNFNKSEDSDKLKLVHYSDKPGLKEIDPKFKGKGVDATVKGRDTWHPHSFYYRHGSEPETRVTGVSPHKYHTSINTKKQPIYDIGTDPESHRKSSANIEETHEKLKNAGYHGFHNSGSALPNVVAMYHPLKVEHEEKHKDHKMNKAEDPESYKKLADKGLMIAHPVKIKGKEKRSDIGTPLHATIKFFNPEKETAKDIHQVASKLKMNPPDPKNTHIEPGMLKDRFGNDVYVIKLHGPHAEEMKSNNTKFSHMGHPASYEYQPHISVSKDTWNKIKNSGAKTAHEAGIEFGHAQIRQGHNLVHSYEPKIKKSEDLNIVKDAIEHDFDLKNKHWKALYLDGEYFQNYILDNPDLKKSAEESYVNRAKHHFGTDEELIKIALEKGIKEAYLKIRRK